jgi:uncharacterized membrane protein
MSETQSNSEALSSATWGFYSVITVSFEDDDNAYAGLTLLNELHSEHQIGLDEAMVIERRADGSVVEKDHVAGSLVGSLFDIEEVDESKSALAAISSSARPGHATLVAVVREQRRAVLDSAMSELGGTVLRRPVYDVEAEIAAAEQAEGAARREARKESLRARREHDQEAVHAKVENLKPKAG